MYGQPSYFQPGNNYGLARDWKEAGLQPRRQFVRDVRAMDIPRPQQNKMIRNYWGPGGRPAHQTPFGEHLADQDPVGTFYRLMGAGGFGPETAYGRAGRNQYDEIYNAYRAAVQINPLLRFEDFFNRGGVGNTMEQRYRWMTPAQRGEIGPSMQQRFV